MIKRRGACLVILVPSKNSSYVLFGGWDRATPLNQRPLTEGSLNYDDYGRSSFILKPSCHLHYFPVPISPVE